MWGAVAWVRPLLHSAPIHFEEATKWGQGVQCQDLEVGFLLGKLSRATGIYRLRVYRF
jgi:hypothetical protein